MPVILKLNERLTYLTGKAGNNIAMCIPLNENIKMEIQKVFL